VHYVAENIVFIFTPVFFPLNCGDGSDKYGERFHQNISMVEHRYKVKCVSGDYCWMMKSDAPETKHHRQAKRTRS
jgi:hypothetical protein